MPTRRAVMLPNGPLHDRSLRKPFANLPSDRPWLPVALAQCRRCGSLAWRRTLGLLGILPGAPVGNPHSRRSEIDAADRDYAHHGLRLRNHSGWAPAFANANHDCTGPEWPGLQLAF